MPGQYIIIMIWCVDHFLLQIRTQLGGPHIAITHTYIYPYSIYIWINGSETIASIAHRTSVDANEKAKLLMLCYYFVDLHSRCYLFRTDTCRKHFVAVILKRESESQKSKHSGYDIIVDAATTTATTLTAAGRVASARSLINWDSSKRLSNFNQSRTPANHHRTTDNTHDRALLPNKNPIIVAYVWCGVTDSAAGEGVGVHEIITTTNDRR